MPTNLLLKEEKKEKRRNGEKEERREGGRKEKREGREKEGRKERGKKSFYGSNAKVAMYGADWLDSMRVPKCSREEFRC